MTTPAQQNSSALQAQLSNGSLAGHWTLDPARSTATLKSKSMWGLAAVNGVFRDTEGEGTVSPTGEVTGRVALKTGTIDTKNTKRDTHLRSDDFFLSDKYPAIVFSIDNITPTDDGVTVSGTLTVRETARPLSFPATVAAASDGELAFDATVQVDRSDFGLTWNQMGMASMKNTIAIHAVLTKN